MKRGLIAISIVASMCLTSCGSDASPPGETDGSPSSAANGAPTEVDLEIARLVRSSGDRLSLTSSQFFGDIDLDALSQGALGGLDVVDDTRLKIAERMESAASKASDSLAALTPQATVAAEVAELGGVAFAAFEACAGKARSFWSGVVNGDVDAGAGREAGAACEASRAAFEEAEAAIDALPDAPTDVTTGDVAAPGEVVEVVLGLLDTDDPQTQEVVQPVSAGSKVQIVLDGQNTGPFRWRLEKSCDGPLTFEVSLIVGSEGTAAIDPSEAGYTGADAPTKEVEASIEGQERFSLDVGTFTVTDGASDTRVSVSFSSTLCPDPQTGSAFDPTSGGPGISQLLTLQAVA